MLGKPSNQLGFADLQNHSRVGDNHFLLKIDRKIDWRRIKGRLDALYDPSVGRPSFPPLTMLKTLLLQQWYSLSDPEAEEAIRDRLSFQRFLDLRATDPVPDETTICRFRNRLIEKRPYEKVFEEIDRQLEEKGLIVKQGSIVDATLVKAHYMPSRKETGDPDASWTVKQDKPHYGYKAHMAVDEGSELIRRVEFTPAHVHDAHVFERMVVGDEHGVYADKGYSGQERREYLERRGIFCGIMEKAVRGHRLGRWQERKNKFISRVRGAVERRFGVLKEHYGYVRVKYRGLERNRCHLFLLGT